MYSLEQLKQGFAADYPYLDGRMLDACAARLGELLETEQREIDDGAVRAAFEGVALDQLTAESPNLLPWQAREVCQKLDEQSAADRVNLFADTAVVARACEQVTRFPASSDDVNETLIGLRYVDDIEVLRARLFYLIFYIRAQERNLHSSSTTEGDAVVANIERNLVRLLEAVSQETFEKIYAQLRELVAVAPKSRVFGININEIREDVACYEENRPPDDPFRSVAEAIRDAAHRRLSGDVIKLINKLVEYLRSDDLSTFIAYRFCKATREQKDAELASPLFERVLHVRDQLLLIWNDPRARELASASASGGFADAGSFFTDSIAQLRQLIGPYQQQIDVHDQFRFRRNLKRTVAAIEARRFDEMEIGSTRYSLNMLIFELAGSEAPGRGRALLSLMTADCVLENISMAYYSEEVNAELAVISEENFDRAIAILPDLVLCTRATGQGTKGMRRMALLMKARLRSPHSLSRVEAQAEIKEMSDELASFVYRLSKFVSDLLRAADRTGPSEVNELIQVRLLNDMIREKTSHLCGNLMSTLTKYLGGEGSPATRQLATTIQHMAPEAEGRRREPSILDVVFHFGTDGAPEVRDQDDVWFMGRKGASETAMSRLIRERELTNVDVPKGFGLCTQTWSLVKDSERRQEALKEVIREQVAQLERRTGKQLGSTTNPLLLIVRSGGIVSLPGILPTIGHLGLNERIVERWSTTLAQPCRAYHAYLRFLFNYAEVVFEDRGVTRQLLFDGLFSNRVAGLCVDDILTLEDSIARVRVNIHRLSGGRHVPDDPYEQLFSAVFKVFAAYKYEAVLSHHKELKPIPSQYQTACLIQDCLPVFNEQDCSGIYFTRNPLDGGEGQIEYIHDFGEDLAAGRASPGSNRKFRRAYPQHYLELQRIGTLTEEENSSPMDVEFAIRDDRLYITQTRPLTLAPMADVVTAYKMYKTGLMSVSELIRRTRRIVGRPLINTFLAEIDKQSNTPIASGQPIAGGVRAGRLIFDVEKIDKFPGENIIFITKSNVPQIAGRQTEIDGYISEEGGVTSHAALVSIGKLPCIVGVKWRKYGKGIRIGNDVFLKEGDLITLDANDGYIYRGKLPVLASPENHPEYLEAEEAILEIARTLEEFAFLASDALE